MKKAILITILFALFHVALQAQKNVTDVIKSELTGVQLPAGSKQDKRILSTTGAYSLLDMKAKELGKKIEGNVEVIYLPQSSDIRQSERVKKILNDSGFKVSAVEGDNKYSLLAKDTGAWLVYINDTKTGADFYSIRLSSEVISVTDSKTGTSVGQAAEAKGNGESPATVTTAGSQLSAPAAAALSGSSKDVTTGNTDTSNSTGFSFTTTNFNDGWTATELADFVTVSKGNILVRIYYPYSITEKMRPPVSEINDYFWNLLVPGLFDVKSAFRFEEGITYFRHYYIFGEAVDKSTGRNCYIGLNVGVNSGIASPILAIAPDRQTYERQFPHPDSIARMQGYNRFAIALKDLTGKWSGSDGATADYYNAVTGSYAGMAFVSTSDEFSFDSSGEYSSRHSGASGMVGNMSTYNQEYKGKAIISNWEMVLPNRWKGQTDTFEAWFEAVKGGRLLKLVDKKYNGMRYTLVRISKE